MGVLEPDHEELGRPLRAAGRHGHRRRRGLGARRDTVERRVLGQLEPVRLDQPAQQLGDAASRYRPRCLERHRQLRHACGQHRLAHVSPQRLHHRPQVRIHEPDRHGIGRRGIGVLRRQP